MIYPEDEKISISPLTQSIAVSRDVSTPGYSFPNQMNLKVTKQFLKAGMQGLGGCADGCSGCTGCRGIGDMSTLNLGDWALLGLAAFFVVPHFMKRF